MGREETKQLYRSGTASVYNTFVSGASSVHQGLYKVAEVIGTTIENRKYIPTYINTVRGWEEAGWFCFSCRGLGGRGGAVGISHACFE